MENHPIPQDITGFQFKLIGNMTIKQFCYLAAGTVLAWFFFFIMPFPLLIRLPLAIIFLGIGVGLAFVPIEGRPMDTMIMNLIRALFAPTQFIYKKNGGSLDQQLNISQAAISQPLPAQPILQQAPTPIPTQAQAYPAVTPQVNPPPQPAPISYQAPQPPLMTIEDDEEHKTEDLTNTALDEANKILESEQKLESQVADLKEQLQVAKSQESAQPAATPIDQSAVHQKALELEKMLIESTRQKEALEQELLSLKAKLEGSQQEKFAPGAAPLKQTQRVRTVPAGMEKSVGVPIASEEPNLILGIVKDPRGNPLPNILVEVKDIDDNPVRAFKTNGIGQFASATSLSNGKYIISFEDPGEKNKFDTVEIEATGAPLMPLEILSVDPREELRRELFN